jgi:tetratricopeptide (TPR) repeat protein
VTLCGLCTSGLGFAQSSEDAAPSDADRAAAQVLFDEGRALMGEEKYEKACAKLAESMRLDRAIGTQLNLGLCYEKIARYASAWINFEEARARAAKAGQESRVEVASEYADRLASRLSKMVVTVDDPADGLVIERDGEVVGDAQWGIEVPVDGGEHVFSANAPGKKSWTTTVTVQPESDRVEVTIPALEDAPEPEPMPLPRPTPMPLPEEEGNGLLIGGIAATSVGAIGLGVGIAFGVLAMNKENASLDNCPAAPNGCTAEGVALRDEAFTFAHVSTAGFVVGGAGLTAGLVMLLLAPSDDDAPSDAGSAIRITPWLGGDAETGNVGIRGRW